MDEAFIRQQAARAMVTDKAGGLRDMLCMFELVDLLAPPEYEAVVWSEEFSSRRHIGTSPDGGSTHARRLRSRTVARERYVRTGESEKRQWDVQRALTFAIERGELVVPRQSEDWVTSATLLVPRGAFRAYLESAGQWPPAPHSRIRAWYPELDSEGSSPRELERAENGKRPGDPTDAQKEGARVLAAALREALTWSGGKMTNIKLITRVGGRPPFKDHWNTAYKKITEHLARIKEEGDGGAGVLAELDAISGNLSAETFRKT